MSVEVPTYDALIHPLLVVLSELREPTKAREVRDLVAERLHVSEEVRAEMLPSGRQGIFDNRVGWAHDRLKRAELSRSAKRGYWQLTEKGVDFAARFPNHLPEEVLAELANVSASSKVPEKVQHAAIKAHGDGPAPSSVTESSTPASASEARKMSPRERLEAAYQDLNDQLASELLEQVRVVDPDFFEVLVLDLLHAMGYGVARSDLRQVGRTGDGGIDGIVHLDQLGLQKVYVQAKRWNGGNSVGRSEIQAFYGALAEQRATYGIFITTSSFSRPAELAARSLSDALVLVDGERLVRLMIQHGIGVSPIQEFKVKRIDTDYFSDE